MARRVLIAEAVIVMCMRVDHPADGCPPELFDVGHDLVGLARVAARVDEQQSVSATYHADRNVQRLVSSMKDAVCDLAPAGQPCSARRSGAASACRLNFVSVF